MATIFQNSYNVHPNRPISYPGPTFWYRSPPIDWAELLPEVDRFLDAVILPWLAQFADCKNVRNALAANDGWAISLWPWEIVAAFDILAHREDDLIVYLSEQQKKALKWDPQWAAKFHSFVESISARLPPIPADPGRTEAAPEEKHRIEPPRLSVFPGATLRAAGPASERDRSVPQDTRVDALEEDRLEKKVSGTKSQQSGLPNRSSARFLRVLLGAGLRPRPIVAFRSAKVRPRCARVSGTRRVAAPVSPFAPRKCVLVGRKSPCWARV